MALPTGVTLGDAGSALWGAAYYQGQKIAGVVNGQFQLADGTLAGSATDADYQAIADAENAQYNTQAQKDYQYQAVIDSPTTSPGIRAIYQNPEWKALQGSGPINYNALSPELQSLIQAVPNLYNNLIAGAWTVAPSTATPTTASDSGSGAATLTGAVTSTPGVASGSGSISRVMDLVAAQFGGGVAGNTISGGGGGGGSGGGLSLSAPVATGGTTSGSKSPVLILLVLAAIVGVAYWIHHKSKRAA